MRILVAEDTLVGRQLLREYLTQMGHSVTLAEDGVEAVAKASESAFDLILMDMWMPRLDGAPAAAKIRENERGTGRRVPIVAVTGHAVKGDGETCNAAGMDGYLQKPFRRHELAEVVERIQSLNSKETGVHPPPLAPWKGTDRDLLPRMAPMMISTTNDEITEIKEAMSVRDAQRVQRAAHSMKGSLGFFHALAAVETVRLLESVVRTGDWARVEAAVRSLELQLPAVFEEIRLRASMP